MPVSDEKNREIARVAESWQDYIEQLYEEKIFELAMRLNLSEKTVERIWEEYSC
jgi:hypothetical protein